MSRPTPVALAAALLAAAPASAQLNTFRPGGLDHFGSGNAPLVPLASISPAPAWGQQGPVWHQPFFHRPPLFNSGSAYFGFGGYYGGYGGYGGYSSADTVFNVYPGGTVYNAGELNTARSYTPPFDRSTGGLRPISGAMAASVVLDLPAVASVSVNGEPVTAGGRTVTYDTRVLRPGEQLDLNVVARWVADGKDYEYTRTVRVGPGDRSRLTVLNGTPVAAKTGDR